MPESGFKGPIFSIIIPSYNEEETLPISIPDLLKHLGEAEISDFELLIVDNGSFDKTGDVIRELMGKDRRIRSVRVPFNQGWGLGVMSGCSQALGRYVVYMCADLQVPHKALVEVCERIAREDSDKVIVKVNRVVRDDGVARGISSNLYNLFINLMFLGVSPDVNGTPKALSLKLWRQLDVRNRGSFTDTEVLIKAKRANARIIEIETVSVKRICGSSTVRISQLPFEMFFDAIKFRLNIT
ncbi:MAG: glycosyltransferase family 2 protein [Candidatus Altiarchaeota archaeon]